MFPDALRMARGRIRADSQNGKMNNGTSACFVIYRSGKSKHEKEAEERKWKRDGAVYASPRQYGQVLRVK